MVKQGEKNILRNFYYGVEVGGACAFGNNPKILVSVPVPLALRTNWVLELIGTCLRQGLEGFGTRA